MTDIKRTSLEPERLYTVAEVAQWLQVHPRTVTRAIEDGSLSALKMAPRITRIPASALRDYVYRCTIVKGITFPV